MITYFKTSRLKIIGESPVGYHFVGEEGVKYILKKRPIQQFQERLLMEDHMIVIPKITARMIINHHTPWGDPTSAW